MNNTYHTPWEITPDPTEYSLKAIKGKYEYEPNEFASVWIARELSEESAKLLAAAPDLLQCLINCLIVKPHKESVEAMKQMIRSNIKKATE